MPKAKFLPTGNEIEVATNTKVLVAANRSKTPLRFGCASCRCGTCAVAVGGPGLLSPMEPPETALLGKMGVRVDGTVRLACQARLIEGDVTVDVKFQDEYDPADGDDGY